VSVRRRLKALVLAALMAAAAAASAFGCPATLGSSWFTVLEELGATCTLAIAADNGITGSCNTERPSLQITAGPTGLITLLPACVVISSSSSPSTTVAVSWSAAGAVQSHRASRSNRRHHPRIRPHHRS
jgi:hypothetical protein